MEETKKDSSNREQNGSPTKLFIPRNSLLTDMYNENLYIRGFYNIGWSILMAFSIHSISYDYLKNNRINLGINLIKIGFPKPFLMVSIWTVIFIASLVPFYGLVAWMTIRKKILKYGNSSTSLLKFFDELAITLYVIFLFGYLYCGTHLVTKYDFPFPTAVALLAEITRLLMKMYSFIRSSVPRAVKSQFDPKFSRYIYFSFAPTLIYQDEYPRLPSIRWNYVTKCLIEFFGVILILTKTSEMYLIRCENFSREPYSWKDVMLLMLESAPVGFLFQIYGCYTLLHSWLNLFAELLRFADRLFYKDWWMSTSYERYYRTWNVVVQDWLYVYVYKDFHEIIFPKNKLVARVALFFISALFHEYIIGFALKLFYPILFIEFFCLSIIVKFLKCDGDVIGNIVFLYTLGLGTAFQFYGYAVIYFSNLNHLNRNVSISVQNISVY